ncbi:MAG: Crp/Fnr family transcriptional regulator [Deltaproteobacteria bacterium]|nr:Crp/Fnr family transcriptional regulator [Deltaproteobacteria bacterium]
MPPSGRHKRSPEPPSTVDTLRALRRNPVLAALDAACLGRLAARLTLRSFRPGDVVFDVGEPVHSAKVMIGGVVGEFGCGPDGSSVLMKVFTSPGLFGDMELFWGWTHFHRAEALTESTVAFIPNDDFQEALRHNARACFLMTKDIAGCVALLSYQLQATLLLPLEVRLANFFLSVAKAATVVPTIGRLELRLGLSQPMLARCLGATERSISRAFAKWKKEGWLRLLPRGGHEFRSLEDLMEHADDGLISLVRRPPLGDGVTADPTLNALQTAPGRRSHAEEPLQEPLQPTGGPFRLPA